MSTNDSQIFDFFCIFFCNLSASGLHREPRGAWPPNLHPVLDVVTFQELGDRSAAVSQTSRSGLERLSMLRLVPCHPAHSRAPAHGPKLHPLLDVDTFQEGPVRLCSG
jgi:hypothetical protein